MTTFSLPPLKGPLDWPLWHQTLQTSCMSEAIWQLVDPLSDQVLAAPPVIPDTDEYQLLTAFNIRLSYHNKTAAKIPILMAEIRASIAYPTPDIELGLHRDPRSLVLAIKQDVCPNDLHLMLLLREKWQLLLQKSVTYSTVQAHLNEAIPVFQQYVTFGNITDVNALATVEELFRQLQPLNPALFHAHAAALRSRLHTTKELRDLIVTYRNDILYEAPISRPTVRANAAYQAAKPDNPTQQTRQPVRCNACNAVHRPRKANGPCFAAIATVDRQAVPQSLRHRLTEDAIATARAWVNQSDANMKSVTDYLAKQSNPAQKQYAKQDNAAQVDHAWALAYGNEAMHGLLILDSTASHHLLSLADSFTDLQPYHGAPINTAGGPIMPDGVGTAQFKIANPQGGAWTMTLLDCHLCTSFTLNLVSGSRLRKGGFFLDDEKLRLYRKTGRSRTPWAYLDEVNDGTLLAIRLAVPHTLAAVAQSGTSKPVDGTLWHYRLGHAGPNAVRTALQNAGLPPARGPTTVECDACATSKATRVNSSVPIKPRNTQPFSEVSIDLFQYQASTTGDKYVALLICMNTKMVRTQVLPSKDLRLLQHWVMTERAWAMTQYALSIKVIHADGETGLLGNVAVRSMIESLGVECHVSDPYTSRQNGSAKRYGRAIMTKARTMLVHSGLPSDLWPEAVTTAAYLHNRTPNATGQSPIENFNAWIMDYRPNYANLERVARISHLRAFGCKAFPLTTKALQNTRKTDLKVEPHAHIGYLVGYVSSKQYRIWVPSLSRVLIASSVTFNESQFYSAPDERVPRSIAETQQLYNILAQHKLATQAHVAASEGVDMLLPIVLPPEAATPAVSEAAKPEATRAVVPGTPDQGRPSGLLSPPPDGYTTPDSPDFPVIQQEGLITTYSSTPGVITPTSNSPEPPPEPEPEVSVLQSTSTSDTAHSPSNAEVAPLIDSPSARPDVSMLHSSPPSAEAQSRQR